MALEIRTYVVTDAGGKILGVKLNRTSAMALHKCNPGSNVEPHMADKLMPYQNQEETSHGQNSHKTRRSA